MKKKEKSKEPLILYGVNVGGQIMTLTANEYDKYRELKQKDNKRKPRNNERKI